MNLKGSMVIFFMTQWFSIPCFALECDLAKMTSCGECFKCGGIWCNDPYESRRCVPLTGGGDEWCPEHMEYAESVDPNSRDGVVFSPQYEDVLAEIGSGKVTTLHVTGYPATKGGNTVYHKILNTTQSSDKSKVRVETSKHILQSTIQVTTTVSAGFCSTSSQKFEYVYVEVGMKGVAEKAVLKYVVPCACGCSEKPVMADQEYCHGHGNLVCGTCGCNDGWHGKFCECGPVSSSCVDPSQSNVRCSGNGQCDKCNQCQCFADKHGSQYFDQQDNCKDLSATVKEFLDCQKLPCGNCDRDVFFHHWDASVLDQLYDASRKLWVDLGSKLPGYWGCIKNSTIHIMRKPC